MTHDSDRIDTISLMFEAARSYLGGAKIIIDSDGINDDQGALIPTLPVTTCVTLAIEIQIKALLIAHSVKRPSGDGHNLLSLFNALPQPVQTQFIEFQTSFTELDDTGLRTLLADEKDTFKTWRYPYERPAIETQPAPLYHVALALSEYLKSHFAIERSDNGWLRKGVT